MKTKPENIKDIFTEKLTVYIRRWQTGLLIKLIIQLTGLFLTGLFIYGFTDLIFAFSAQWRIAINIILLISIIVLFIKQITHIFKLPQSEAAKRADQSSGNQRQLILTAQELHPAINKESTPELAQFLIKRSIAKATEELSNIPLKIQFPLNKIRKQTKTFLLQLTFITILFAINPTATNIILQRIISPGKDIPPYSKLSFSITPLNPSVLYGNNINISVNITGKLITGQVWLVTRSGSKTYRTACFQETDNTFAQRLEKVTEPISFCFSTGKARSEWHDINIRMQPEITLVSATVTPPQYSHLPTENFLVGNNKIKALAGSQIELKVTSNRPLLNGLLTITPIKTTDEPASITGIKTDTHTVIFKWKLNYTADVAVTIRDIQGTSNRTRYKFMQYAEKDLPPTAAINSPAAFSIATPNSNIPVTCNANDDIGLRQVNIIRTIAGYRDRILQLTPETYSSPTLQYDTKLDLKKLGTEPGQIIELYLEAQDNNPDLTGFTASDITRIKIISDKEYAEMLRIQVGINEFMERFYIVDKEIKKLRKSMQNLKKLTEDKSSTPEAIKKAIENVRQHNKDLTALFNKLANDFAVYDIEKSLASALGTTTEILNKQQNTLQQMTPDTPELPDKVEKMINELNKSEKKIANISNSAKEIADVARLMQDAAIFKQLIQRQEDIVRRMERYSGNHNGSNMARLAALGRKEAEIEADLNKLLTAIKEHSSKLSPAFYDLSDDAFAFVEIIESLKISDLMKNSSVSADNQDGANAYRFAALALEKLQKTKTECKGRPFGGMCNNKICFNSPECMETTLKQMLESIGMRMGGNKSGTGSGSGAGGQADGNGSGYWMNGYSPLNVPIFGPQRTRFSNKTYSGTGGTGPDNANGRTKKQIIKKTETLSGGSNGTIYSESLPLEQIPPAYRDAVKRYFQQKE